MKKLFLAICFSAAVLFPAARADAKATELNNPIELEQRKQMIPETATQSVEDDSIPDAKDPEAVDKFLKERLTKVVITQVSDADNSINIQRSSEYINQMNEENKPTFQKIYDEAIRRISNNGQHPREDIAGKSSRHYSNTDNQQKKDWKEKLDFAVVNIDLPTGERIIAPAMEHIPYLFSRIEILPTGMVSISETITVVANGEKLKHGLARVIPRYSVSRANTINKIDVSLISVDINGQEIPHKLEAADNKIYIIPVQEYVLNPGVYTYTFNYVIDRQLWEYENFKEFYWDVSGSSWNLVIARAGASVKLPGQSAAISQTALLGYTDTLSGNNIISVKSKAPDNILGFASKRPLFIGEGMHILAAMPLADFIAPDFNKRLTWFIDDYGNLLFSIFGLLAVLISYYLSWKHLEKDEKKYSIRKTAATMRYLAKGYFDKTAFGAFLLEMFRKNIIDIQKSGNDILLIKRTDNLATLTRLEKKAVNALFTDHEAVLAVNDGNLLKLKRAYKFIEKDTERRLKSFMLKLNLSYLAFSIGMLLMVILAISALSINILQTAVILISCCITLAFYIWILNAKIKNKILRWISKIFAVFIILFTMLIMSIYIHPFSVLIIAAMIYAIFAYTIIFAKRNGLIRNNVKEAQEYKNYLLRNAESISLGRDFLSQQANIFAFEVTDKFPEAQNIKDYYRLDAIADVIKKL